jgi:hypothetical protein
MLANIQLVTKNLAHDNGTILLDGTQGKPPNHVTLTKQIQDEYRD